MTNVRVSGSRPWIVGSYLDLKRDVTVGRREVQQPRDMRPRVVDRKLVKQRRKQSARARRKRG